VQFALFVAGTLEMLLGVQFDPVQIVVIEGQAAQRCIQRRGELLERGLIEATQRRAAIAVGARPAIGCG
jgi:hypothetical protein